jgi:hypothetical protein
MRTYGISSMREKCVILAHEKNEGQVTLKLVKGALG